MLNIAWPILAPWRILVNPIEWFAWIYGKFFLGHPYRGGIVVAVMWAVFGLFLWFRGVDKYREEHPERVALRDSKENLAPSLVPQAPASPVSSPPQKCENLSDREQKQRIQELFQKYAEREKGADRQIAMTCPPKTSPAIS
jgi:hypothetical protein